MRGMNRRTFFFVLGVISILGMVLRWTGIRFEGVDFKVCLEPWYQQLKEGGTLAALAGYDGDYNLFYVTILYLLTLVPAEPIISIKMVSILFDYVAAFAVMQVAMSAGEETGKGRFYGALACGLVLCNPVAVINSGYLAQSESIWAGLALLGFWYLSQEKPVRGMWMLGFALAMKLQAVFILPIVLILYFYKKTFSILHLLWIPIAIQVSCIPAIIGGCGFDVAYRTYFRLMGEYPFMYYYYPNIWTFFKEAPYYLLGKAAIVLAFMALLMFAVLFVQSGRRHVMKDYLEYVAWTTMTCAMLLPCMHERYNYIAEIVLPVCAVFEKKYRVPAAALVLLSALCYGGSYLGWSPVSHYALAAGNLLIYFYLTWKCFYGLYDGCRAGKRVEPC